MKYCSGGSNSVTTTVCVPKLFDINLYLCCNGLKIKLNGYICANTTDFVKYFAVIKSVSIKNFTVMKFHHRIEGKFRPFS